MGLEREKVLLLAQTLFTVLGLIFSVESEENSDNNLPDQENTPNRDSNPSVISPELESNMETASSESIAHFEVVPPSRKTLLKWIGIFFFLNLVWFAEAGRIYLLILLIAFSYWLWKKMTRILVKRILLDQLQYIDDPSRRGFFTKFFLITLTGNLDYYVEKQVAFLSLENIKGFFRSRGIDLAISTSGVALTFAWFISVLFLPSNTPAEEARGQVLFLILLGALLASVFLSFYLPITWVLRDSGFKSFDSTTKEIELVSSGFKQRLDRVFGLSGILAARDLFNYGVPPEEQNLVSTYFILIFVVIGITLFLSGASLITAFMYLRYAHADIVNETRSRLIREPFIGAATTRIDKEN